MRLHKSIEKFTRVGLKNNKANHHHHPMFPLWCFQALNLTYDVTSSKYISVVLTELGQLTCIAAPGIMRKKIELDKLNYD